MSKLFYTLIAITLSGVHSKVGDECDIDGVSGVCKLLKDCAIARNKIKLNIAPTHCPSDGTPGIVVCCESTEVELRLESECPPVPTEGVHISRDGKKKAKDACIDWNELLHPCVNNPNRKDDKYRKNVCGHVSAPLVIDGEEAKPKEFPHMAALGFSGNSWDCGGTLISDQWVLTAAHCTWTCFTSSGSSSFRINLTPSKKRIGGSSRSNQCISRYVNRVRLGDTNIKNPPDRHKFYTVVKIVTHPDYKTEKVYNDIALLKLDRKVKFSEFVIPACLPTDDGDNDEKAMATGWGLTKAHNDSSKSDILMKVTLEKFPEEDCSKNLRSPSNPEGLRNATQLCYGSGKNKDTCQGDSGGPLQIYNQDVECTYTVIGITSFGRSCGGTEQPAVYTRVAPYISWIESVVWP